MFPSFLYIDNTGCLATKDLTYNMAGLVFLLLINTLKTSSPKVFFQNLIVKQCLSGSILSEKGD